MLLSGTVFYMKTGEKLTKVLINYWQDQQTIQQLEFKRLRAELEEQEQINQETWQQVTDILNKIKEGEQEEQKAQRPTSNRIIKQASKSEINRTDPESEQYTDEFINSIYQSLTGTQTTKTKGKQKARCFKSRKTTITNLSSFNLSEAERNLLRRGLNFIPNTNKGTSSHNLTRLSPV